MQNKNPFCEVRHEKSLLRWFTEDVEEKELIWHKDRKDRKVRVIGGKNWQIQFDNELPIKLEQNKEYFVPKETYHRIIKGEYNLILEIEE
jgi:hypothetical protein